jgi:phosphohistidine swiveling domain-containing protein
MYSPVTSRRSAAVLHLSDPDATDPGRVGAKAAALARARRAGIEVLDGFVVTPAAALSVTAGEDGIAVTELRDAWTALSRGGALPLVVRSSSAHEDTATSSMAGRFESVLDVRGWDPFLAAVRAVVASGHAAAEAGVVPSACMGVLVQPFVEPALGGVLFGSDPVSGRTDRLLVSVVEGSPDRLVAGAADGYHLVLRPSGRVVEAGTGALALVPVPVRRRLARLAGRLHEVFGSPQDVEWALVDDGILLLQSRPITAATAQASGPLLGPGPVAETFPDPLSALERDLWVDPLREGIRGALALSGAVSAKALAASPVVVTVGGRVAVDLELLGAERPGRRSVLAVLDPRPPLRRLRASWRVGRLRAALPALARDVVSTVDARLAGVPPLEVLDSAGLLELLFRVRRTLVAVHGHEVLTALLLGGATAPVSAAGAALELLAERPPDLDDGALVSRYPVLLALSAPRIGASPALPAVASAPAVRVVVDEDDPAVLRESLRLRARWLHELSARAAAELGERLAAQHRITDAHAIRELELRRVAGLVSGRVALDLGGEAPQASPPLPARFRLAPNGEPVAVHDGASSARGAGGGRGMGVVAPRGELPVEGAVLVVPTLDPALASLLPGLAGIVAETGSPLSHLAILARELGVPAVVGVPDAVRRFPPGTVLVVDGHTGEVEVAGEAAELARSGPR